MTRPIDEAIRAACATDSSCRYPNCNDPNFCRAVSIYKVRAARDVFLADTPEAIEAMAMQTRFSEPGMTFEKARAWVEENVGG